MVFELLDHDKSRAIVQREYDESSSRGCDSKNDIFMSKLDETMTALRTRSQCISRSPSPSLSLSPSPSLSPLRSPSPLLFRSSMSSSPDDLQTSQLIAPVTPTATILSSSPRASSYSSNGDDDDNKSKNHNDDNVGDDINVALNLKDDVPGKGVFASLSLSSSSSSSHLQFDNTLKNVNEEGSTKNETADYGENGSRVFFFSSSSSCCSFPSDALPKKFTNGRDNFDVNTSDITDAVIKAYITNDDDHDYGCSEDEDKDDYENHGEDYVGMYEDKKKADCQLLTTIRRKPDVKETSKSAITTRHSSPSISRHSSSPASTIGHSSPSRSMSLPPHARITNPNPTSMTSESTRTSMRKPNSEQSHAFATSTNSLSSSSSSPSCCFSSSFYSPSTSSSSFCSYSPPTSSSSSSSSFSSSSWRRLLTILVAAFAFTALPHARVDASFGNWW